MCKNIKSNHTHILHGPLGLAVMWAKRHDILTKWANINMLPDWKCIVVDISNDKIWTNSIIDPAYIKSKINSHFQPYFVCDAYTSCLLHANAARRWNVKFWPKFFQISDAALRLWKRYLYVSSTATTAVFQQQFSTIHDGRWAVGTSGHMEDNDDFVDVMQSQWHVLDVSSSVRCIQSCFHISPKWFISIICI